MLENIKTLAINKSEVSGKLFRKSTTVTVSMLEYKASMSCSKTPARRRQKRGFPTLILLLSLSRPSLPPPRKRQETPQGEAWTWWKWVLLFPWKPGEGPGHSWLQSWGGEEWWSRGQRRAHLTQASSGVRKGGQVLGVRWASVSHPGVWALFPRAKEKGHLVFALCPHHGPAQSPGSF